MRFQVLFHSPRRGAFHLSLTVLVHYRSQAVFSLAGWSRLLPAGFHVSRGTQDPPEAGSRFRLQGCHLLWPAVPGRSTNAPRTSFRRLPAYRGPPTPDSPRGSPGLGCSGFARHYSRNHGCFLFLWVLRWFTSPGSPPAPMDSEQDKLRSRSLGSPIRTSPDHDLLAVPRGLSQLTTSFIAYLRQGIHTHALSSLTIKFTPDTTRPSARRQLAVARQYSVVKDPRTRLSSRRRPALLPIFLRKAGRRRLAPPSGWWAWVELNYRPHPYQGCALTT